ncbi:universal stress protein [Oceanospirillum linum]|uniref:Universal stress protein n=1 Tax=Oceanospirillum linum TaxID=966 RepID=A0A1T1HEC2_OCELI|nr:universal stress protein [Oceanospirillum linum]OOV88173.1 universal stress protein [Oceanospirillum linum]SEF46204.1 Nucleotide-binding universal stress protein, UspA family [Oleiphilus messinensis]SMP02057.1 Nucleotide-binding universal stress protein, UspA family [Oceanospirillum linum]
MLPGVNRILYASDIRPGSRPAFRAAMSLCGHYKSQITFLHVVEPVSGHAERLVRSMMSDDPSLKALHDESLQHVQQQVVERVERFCREELDASEMLADGQLEARVEEGSPWKKILEVAEEIDATVIVMGVRHQNSLLGDTPTKVMHHCRRPILTVPL